jgi:hypothetical protein
LGEGIDKLGGIVSNLKKALDMTADAFVSGKPIPEKAFSLITKNMMPPWAYLKMATMSMKGEAKKNKVYDKLYDKPYQKV